MKRPGTLLLATLAALTISACGGSETVIALCPELGVDRLLPATVVSPTGVWDVTYTATATAGAVVTSLQYRDGAGVLQTVTNPTFPFTYAMSSKPPGTRVVLQATATAPPGLVSLEVRGVSGPAGAQETVRWASSCGQ